MKHFKTVVVPAKAETTKQELDKTTCDICGLVIETEQFSEEKVTVQYKTGNSYYPEGGSGEVEGVDMCPNCWKEKLVPWLRAQGCDIHTVEWDW